MRGGVKIATTPVSTGKFFSQNFLFIRVQYLQTFIPVDGASFESVGPVLVGTFKRKLGKYFFAQIWKFVNDPLSEFNFIVINGQCLQDLRNVTNAGFKCILS